MDDRFRFWVNVFFYTSLAAFVATVSIAGYREFQIKPACEASK